MTQLGRLALKKRCDYDSHDMALRVFISYSHDSPEHSENVWNLCDRLRNDGIDCRIDQHEISPHEGWPRWCRNQVQESEFVLVVCTETYRQRFEGKAEAGTGLGANLEGSLITLELYRAECKNRRFIPVVFADHDLGRIPIELSGAQYHNLAVDTGYENLYRHLTNQPTRIASPVAEKQRPMPQLKRDRKFPSSKAKASTGLGNGRRETLPSQSYCAGPTRQKASVELGRGRRYLTSAMVSTLIVLIGTILVIRQPHLTTILGFGGEHNGSPQLTAIVAAITRGVGSVAAVRENGSSRVIVFEEIEHGSLRGQIEIAIMLNRLYEHYGVRGSGQEGVLVDEGPLRTSWYHPSLQAGAALSQRDKVAVQLLARGEISSAEMLALVYPDFRVEGIEKAVEYNVVPPSTRPELIYLMAIAEETETPDQWKQVEDLFRQGKSPRAVDLLKRNNPFVQEQWDFFEKWPTTPAEVVSRIERIQTEANRVHARISDHDHSDLEQEKIFFQRADSRSDTMSENVIKLAKNHTEMSFALVIGAVHTERVSRALERAGFSYAVVRPESFAGEVAGGGSEQEWFERKSVGLSVDKKGMLGAFLDGRKKPAPVAQRVWFSSKAEAYVLTALIACMPVSDEPVLTPQVYAELQGMHYVALVPSTFRVSGKDRIFEFRAQVENRQGPVDVWVRTAKVSDETTLNLEIALTKALADVANQRSEPVKTTDHPVLVTSEVVAVFSRHGPVALPANYYH